MNKLEIIEVRKMLGLNQGEFAQLFGVHQMTVSRWERGELEPTPYHHALLDEFKTAAKKEEAKENLKLILIGAGLVAAIYFLLKLAKEGK